MQFRRVVDGLTSRKTGVALTSGPQASGQRPVSRLGPCGGDISPGEHLSYSLDRFPAFVFSLFRVRSPERIVEDILRNFSPRCLPVITGRAEVNAGKHAGVYDFSKSR
jgi:hypothetical protein